MAEDQTSPFRPRVEPVLVTLPDGCRVAARVFGPEDAPPVLFVAGGDGRMLQWRGLIPELCVDDAERELFAAAGCDASLAADLRVAAFDARGTGWSSRSHGVCTTTAAAAGDALALGAALFEGPFHLVGHALGAAVALEVALAAGRLVRSLTLISGTPGGERFIPPAREALEARSALAEALEGGASRDELGELVRRDTLFGFTPAFARAHAALVEHLVSEALDDLVGEDGLRRHGATATTASEGRGEQFAALDLVGRLGEVGAPTLVVHGEHDAVLPADNGRALAGGIPGARLAIFDAGHAVTIERAGNVAASLRAHVLLRP